ncbi:MAG: alpha/beta fold hydrolase [Lacisediminihabitans sp.]
MTAFVTTAEGIRIAYRREPGPRTVLLVHGFATNAALTWDATGWLRVFAEAGRGTIAVDLRGHGRSSAPHDAAAYSPEILAADLVVVLDAEGVDQVDVLAYSMGCQVARAFVRAVPERVGRLVLGGMGSVEQFGHWGVDALRGVLLDGRTIDDPVAAGLMASVLAAPGTDRRALAACVTGMAAHPVEGAPGVPTLLVVGEADPVATGSAAAAHTLGMEFAEIPKRNHVTTLSARAFKQVALPFLDASGIS